MRKNLVIYCGVICVVASISWVDSKAFERPIYLTVAAGSLDRKDNVVSFAMPNGLRAKSYVLRGDAGSLLPVQVEPDGTATFVLPALKAGTSKRYQLVQQNANAGAVAADVQ